MVDVPVEDISDDEVSHEGGKTPAQWLRWVCVRPRDGGTFCKIRDFLASLDARTAADAVTRGNRNRKTLLHVVSQIRGDDKEGPELVELFLDYGADINGNTRRGHTPLIFAAGRGHNEVVRALLRRGGDPRVMTVTGDTAASMGQSRLEPEAYAELKAAEVASNCPWRDFRDCSDAQSAQAEHVRLCPYCRQKFGLDEAAARAEREALQSLSTEIAADLSCAFSASSESEATAALAEVLVKRSKQKEALSALDPALRAAFWASERPSAARLRWLFIVVQEDALGSALLALGHRDRRTIRTVLAALLAELGERPEALDEMEARELANLPDSYLAMELMLRKSRYNFVGDSAAVEDFWRERCGGRSFLSHSSEVSLISSQYLSKKKGGPILAAQLRKLRWACHMAAATGAWREMVNSTVDEVVASGLARQMIDQLDDGTPPPSCVRERLEAAAQGEGGSLSVCRAKVDCRKTRQAGSLTAPLPDYELIAEVRWISGDEDLAAMRTVLDESIGHLESEDTLLIGLDCEWGDRGPGPSIVQLATLKLAFVIDVLDPTDATREFFRWIFRCGRLAPLGFSFAQDTLRLDALMESGLYGASSSRVKVADLQALALEHMPRDCTPGLKAVVEAWLHRSLDKTHQGSDWDRRPLSSAQLSYAAADAAVLLDVAAVMGVRGRGRVPARPPPARDPA